MKKFLSVVSLLLVAMMILAMPTVSAAEDNSWVKPEGVNVWYANDVSENTPSVDGVIDEGEYGKLSAKITPKAALLWGTKWATDPVDPTLSSEYMDFYFAYDEENIYIAIYEMGPAFVDNGDDLADNDVVKRNNYTFKIGFDLNDVKKYFQFGGYQTNVHWASLSYFDMGGEAGSAKNDLPIGVYSFITECIVKKTDVATGEDFAYGDLISANGNKEYTKGQWSTTMEFKISKADYIQTINDVFGTEYNNVSDAMWLIVDTTAYKNGAAGEKLTEQYFRCLGQNDVTGKQDNYIDYGVLEGSTRNSLPDVIVFGDENTAIRVASPEGDPIETEAPATEAPVVDDVTEAPAADDVTEAPATEEPAKSGCGASVSLAGIALVAALGTCTVFVAKKKEN